MNRNLIVVKWADAAMAVALVDVITVLAVFAIVLWFAIGWVSKRMGARR